jgi:hypothetical protein
MSFGFGLRGTPDRKSRSSVARREGIDSALSISPSRPFQPSEICYTAVNLGLHSYSLAR